MDKPYEKVTPKIGIEKKIMEMERRTKIKPKGQFYNFQEKIDKGYAHKKKIVKDLCILLTSNIKKHMHSICSLFSFQ